MSGILTDFLRWSLILIGTGIVVALVGIAIGYVQLRWFPPENPMEDQ